MIRIVLCDDDRLWLAKAADMISSFTESEEIEAEVYRCDSPSGIPDLFTEESVDAGYTAPDVVFMDIEFDKTVCGEDRSGIEAAKDINRMYPDCKVVFLTNYLNYALDVYQTEHMWYTTKEQFADRLPDIFAKVSKMESELKSKLVIGGANGKQVCICCSDIKYLERHDRRTIIKTGGGEHVVHQRIPVLQDKLPSESFGRCHTSFIVNFEKIASIGEKSLLLNDGTEILISRGFGKSFRTKYMNWAGEQAVR